MNTPTLIVKIRGVVYVDVLYTDYFGRHYGLFREPYEKVRCPGGINIAYLIEAFGQKYAITVPDNVSCKITYPSLGGRQKVEKRIEPSLQAANKRARRNKLSRTWGLLVLRNTVNVIRKRK